MNPIAIIFLIFIPLTSLAQPTDIKLALQKGHSDEVLTVAFSPNGKYLATGGKDKKIIVYDLRSLRTIWELDNKTEVYRVCWDRESALLYSTGQPGINVWNIGKGILQTTLRGGPDDFLANYFAVSPDYKHIVFGATFSFGVYRSADMSLVKEYKATDLGVDEIGAAQFVSSSRLVFQGIRKKERAKNIHVFDWVAGKMISTLPVTVAKAPEEWWWNGTKQIAVYDSSRVAYSDSYENLNNTWAKEKVYVHDPITGSTRNFKIDTAGYIVDLAFNATGTEILAAVPGISIRIYDAKSFKRRLVIPLYKSGFQYFPTQIVVSPDNRYLACATNSNDVLIFDYRTGKLIEILRNEVSPTRLIYFPDSTRMITQREGQLVFWDLADFRNIHAAGAGQNIFIDSKYRRKGDTLYTLGAFEVDLWNLDEERHIKGVSLRPPFQPTHKVVDFDVDGRYIASITQRAENAKNKWIMYDDVRVVRIADSTLTDIKTYREATNSHLYSFAVRLKKGLVQVVSLAMDTIKKQPYFVVDEFSLVDKKKTKSLNLYVDPVNLGEVITKVAWGYDNAGGPTVIPTDSSLLFVSTAQVTNYLFSGGVVKILEKSKKYRYIFSLTKSDKHELILTTSAGEVITISKRGVSINVMSEKTIKFASGGNQAHRAFTTSDGWVDFVPAGQKKPSVKIIPFLDGEYFLSNNDNYFYSSPRGLNKVHFQRNLEILPARQYEYLFNQPQKLLTTIGMANPGLIRSYEGAYKYRLEKLNLEAATADVRAPELSVSYASGEVLTTQPKARFSIKASDVHPLTRLKVVVNNVRVNGLTPKLSKAGLELNQDVDINLSTGLNKIAISVMNSRGVESAVQLFEITYSPARPVKPRLFLYLLASSAFQDTTYNLKYAVKDVKDIAALFARKSIFSDIVVDSLLGKRLLKENFVKLAATAKGITEDDYLVLYIAGHGLLDEKLNYFIASHDCDFSSPAKKSIPYSMIEDFVNASPSRNKLIFIDACHAGEVDTRALTTKMSPEESRDVTVIPFRSNPSGYNFVPTNSFNLIGQLFADLTKDAGTTVIAATSGDSFALEMNEIRNGVFTHSLLDACKNGKADKNFDRVITVSELQNYIYDRVARLTNGRQRPVNRAINVEKDLVLFRVE